MPAGILVLTPRASFLSQLLGQAAGRESLPRRTRFPTLVLDQGAVGVFVQGDFRGGRSGVQDRDVDSGSTMTRIDIMRGGGLTSAWSTRLSETLRDHSQGIGR